MTKRQTKLVANLKNGKHKTLSIAAKSAGYKNTQTNLIERSVRSVLGKYLQALEDAGATDEKSARVISQGMDAVRKIRNIAGVVVEEMPDHKMRLTANEQFMKAKRLLEPEDNGKEPTPFNLTIAITNENNITPQAGNRISEYIEI